MTPFAILAPDLDTPQTKLLRAALTSVRLPWVEPVDTLPRDATRHVLSVGREAVKVWHDFGLIRIGANHGDVFTHRHPVTAQSYTIMVLEHPGTLQQLSIVGHQARDNMTTDLRRWRMILDDLIDADVFTAEWCGGCLKMRDPKHRPAEHWVEELDGVGLCEDHYRKRSNYRRKSRTVPVKDRGKMEHQIAGQREMFGGDGTKVMVTKS